MQRFHAFVRRGSTALPGRHWGFALASASLALLACAAPVGVTVAQAEVAAFARACGDPEAAPTEVIKQCGRALETQELGPKGTAQAFLNRGAAFATLGNHEQALRDFDAAAASHAGIQEIWANRGRALLRLEKPQEALKSYERALEMSPEDAESQLGRATALVELGAADKALPALETLLAADERNLRVRYQRARAYGATGAFDPAMADLAVILKAAPKALAARLLEAQLWESKDAEKAKAAYAKAIEIAPDDPRAYYRRGRLLDRGGDPVGAKPDLKRAWDLGYRDEWLNDWLLKSDD